MNVLITNTVALNGGDAAILMAVSRQVRAAFGAGTKIIVADTQPDIARRYYPEQNFIEPLYMSALPPRKEGRLRRLHGAARFAHWYLSLPRLYAAAYLIGRGLAAPARRLVSRRQWETLRRYADADLIVSTGGTYLVQNYWLAPRIFEFRIALLLRKPLLLYTQSMGPFGSMLVRQALGNVFRKAALVLLRDRMSMDHVLELNGSREITARLAPDAAFALAEPQILESAAAAELPSEGIAVCISVRAWPYFKSKTAEEGMHDYLSAIAQLAEHLITTRGASITFLSTCQGIPEYAYDDSVVARDVADRIRPGLQERVAVDGSFHTPEDLLTRLRNFDLVVATRMHMAILALAAGVPVFPIAYEFKTRALFDHLGMGENVSDIEHVTGRGLSDGIDRMIDQLPAKRADLFGRVEEERRRAEAVVEYLEAVRLAHGRNDVDAEPMPNRNTRTQ